MSKRDQRDFLHRMLICKVSLFLKVLFSSLLYIAGSRDNFHDIFLFFLLSIFLVVVMSEKYQIYRFKYLTNYTTVTHSGPPNWRPWARPRVLISGPEWGLWTALGAGAQNNFLARAWFWPTHLPAHKFNVYCWDTFLKRIIDFIHILLSLFG